MNSKTYDHVNTRCKWCNRSENLVKGYCFECYSMSIVHAIGYGGSFSEYDKLCDNAQEYHWAIYPIGRTAYRFNNTSSVNN